MKITFIISRVNVPGGMEVHTVHLINLLQRRGHEITLVEFDSDYYRSANIDRRESIRFLHEMTPGSLCDIGPIRAFSALSRAGGDVCVFPKGTMWAGNWLLDMAARALFRRYVTIEHLASGPLPEKGSRRYLGRLLPGVGLWWYRTMLSRRLRAFGPSKIICVSEIVRGDLVRTYGFRENKTVTVHNGIDSHRFDADPVMRTARRSEWGATSDTLVFGAIGRMEPVKGYDLIIPLFARLVERYRDSPLMLVLIGEGSMSGELDRMIRDYGLEGRALLCGPTGAPWEVYPAIDVFLMPSRNEGLPLALLEAMSCGCVPIGMSVGGVSEVIADPGVGWLIPAGNETGFHDAMAAAVETGHSGLAGMGERARSRVVSHFNADHQYGMIADLLEMDPPKYASRMSKT